MRKESTGPMTVRSLALRTLFPGFDGTDAVPSWLERFIEDGLGGVVLFGRNVSPDRGDAGVADLVARIKRIRPDVLVAIDEEGGDVTRLDVATGSTTPGNAALGAAGDPELTREVAASLGQRLRDLGVDINFAPVADVDADPNNPIVGVRSFGANPADVARHTEAFVAGHQLRGIAATVKHFPGHGATTEDSHLTVPVVEAPRTLLDRRELVPFRAAVDAGVQAVMTAHIRVLALDREVPATLSDKVVTGLLREALGFDGLIITDGLDMHAISRTAGHADGGVRALIAGVDALCIGGETTEPDVLEEMIEAIEIAVRTGRLSYGRLAEAASRVSRLVGWVRAAREHNAGTSAASVPHELVEQRAARRAVVSRGEVRLTAPPLVLELQDDPSLAAGPVPWGIGAHVAERMPGTVVVSIWEDGPAPHSVLARYPDRPIVMSVRDVRSRPWQKDLVKLVRERDPGAVVVDHGMPAPGTFDEPYLLAYGASRATAAVAADMIAGATSAHGRAGA